jgi:hypothetical protein
VDLEVSCQSFLGVMILFRGGRAGADSIFSFSLKEGSLPVCWIN